MSLNNRISIRDAYGARGAVDCQVATFPSSYRSEATSDVIVLNAEKHKKNPMNHSQAEADKEDNRVVSELSDFILLFSSHVGCCSLDCRHSVILITQI